MGVMVSASHNPAADNGVKFFTDQGFKFSEEAEEEIENRLREGPPWAAPVGEGVGAPRPGPGSAGPLFGHRPQPLRRFVGGDAAGFGLRQRGRFPGRPRPVFLFGGQCGGPLRGPGRDEHQLGVRGYLPRRFGRVGRGPDRPGFRRGRRPPVRGGRGRPDGQTGMW